MDPTMERATEVHAHEGTARTVREFYAAVGSGDVGTALTLLDPAATLFVPGSHHLAGEYVGHDDIVGFVLRSGVHAQGTEHTEVEDVLVGDHHAAVVGRVRARRADGEELDNRTVHLLGFGPDGRIVDIAFHNRDQVHVDAFWGPA